MKGIIFTEFMDLVESAFGFDTVDEIIERSDLPSGGAYTAVGTYDHGEIASLVTNLSEISGKSVPDLLHLFGAHLFSRFSELYPDLIGSSDNALDFLESVENYIHVEVRKLYPNAELPRFDCSRPGPGELVMVYHSGKHLEDLAGGLIEGCLAHFGETATVDRSAGDRDDDGVTFHIKRTG